MLNASPLPALHCKILLILTDAVKRWEIMHEVFAHKRPLPGAEPTPLSLPEEDAAWADGGRMGSDSDGLLVFNHLGLCSQETTSDPDWEGATSLPGAGARRLQTRLSFRKTSPGKTNVLIVYWRCRQRKIQTLFHTSGSCRAVMKLIASNQVLFFKAGFRCLSYIRFPFHMTLHRGNLNSENTSKLL